MSGLQRTLGHHYAELGLLRLYTPSTRPFVREGWSSESYNVYDVYMTFSFRGEEVTDDDLEIVQLALLWSTMLLITRPTLFQSFSSPSDAYCRLSEIYTMGLSASAGS